MRATSIAIRLKNSLHNTLHKTRRATARLEMQCAFVQAFNIASSFALCLYDSLWLLSPCQAYVADPGQRSATVAKVPAVVNLVALHLSSC